MGSVAEFSWTRTALHPETQTPRFPKPKRGRFEFRSSVGMEQAPASEGVVVFRACSVEEVLVGSTSYPKVKETCRACDVSALRPCKGDGACWWLSLRHWSWSLRRCGLVFLCLGGVVFFFWLLPFVSKERSATQEPTNFSTRSEDPADRHRPARRATNPRHRQNSHAITHHAAPTQHCIPLSPSSSP